MLSFVLFISVHKYTGKPIIDSLFQSETQNISFNNSSFEIFPISTSFIHLLIKYSSAFLNRFILSFSISLLIKVFFHLFSFIFSSIERISFKKFLNEILSLSKY